MLFIFSIWTVLSLEKRILKFIYSDAKNRKISIRSIRNAEDLNEKKVFDSAILWIGVNSSVFGFRGERVFNKVVETDKGKFYVQVKTTFFLPMSIKWKTTDG